MAELTTDEKTELRKAAEAALHQHDASWVTTDPRNVLALLDENARLEAEVAKLVQQAQDRQTALAQGWAKLREEKRSIRELAWDAGRNSADERNPYR